MIITRYVNKRLIFIFLSVLMVLLILAISVEIIKNIDKLVNTFSSGKYALVSKYLMLKMVFMLFFLVPSSLSVAGALCFCSLWRTNEIISILTSGMSKVKMLRSSIIISVVIGVMLFAIDEFCLPILVPEVMSIESEIKTRDITTGVTSVHETGSRFDASLYNRREQIVENIEVIFLDENLGKQFAISARKGRWNEEKGSWILYEGTIVEYEGGITKVIDTGDKKVLAIRNIRDDGYIVGEGLFKPKTFFQSKLMLIFGSKLRTLRKMIRGYPGIPLYKTALGVKFMNLVIPVALLLSCVAIILIRQVKSYALCVTIVLFCNLVFYALHILMITSGILGSVNPYLSVSIVPFLFLAYGVYRLKS